MSPWWWCVALRDRRRAGRATASVGMLARDEAERGLEPGALARDVDAKAAVPPDASSAKSHEPSSLERTAEPLRDAREEHVLERVASAAAAPRPSSSPGDPEERRAAGDEVQIAGAHLARLLQQLLECPGRAARGSRLRNRVPRSGRRCRARVGPRRLCLSGRGNDGRRGGVLQDHRYGRFARGRRGFAHDADLNLVGRSRGEDAERSYRVELDGPSLGFCAEAVDVREPSELDQSLEEDRRWKEQLRPRLRARRWPSRTGGTRSRECTP